MNRKSLVFLIAIGLGVFLLAVTDEVGKADDKPVARKVEPAEPEKTRAELRVLPGVQSSGVIQLPNQWSLRPAGQQIELGDFPINIALHPSGKWLAVLHAGYGDHEVAIVDLKRARKKVICRVGMDQAFYGLCFSPDGKTLFASGGINQKTGRRIGRQLLGGVVPVEQVDQDIPPRGRAGHVGCGDGPCRL